MDKQAILDILDELYGDISGLREDGETDLRTVLRMVSSATRDIVEELNK